MAVKRSYIRRNTIQTKAAVPISPDQANRRRAKIEAQREYLEKLKSGGQMSDGTTAMRTENIDIAAIEKQLVRDERALK